jgi:hypothetical protein
MVTSKKRHPQDSKEVEGEDCKNHKDSKKPTKKKRKDLRKDNLIWIKGKATI